MYEKEAKSYVHQSMLQGDQKDFIESTLLLSFCNGY